MKISIELEVGPHELGLASELLKTLRLLTDHVKVNTAGTSATAGRTGPSSSVPLTVALPSSTQPPHQQSIPQQAPINAHPPPPQLPVLPVQQQLPLQQPLQQQQQPLQPSHSPVSEPYAAPSLVNGVAAIANGRPSLSAIFEPLIAQLPNEALFPQVCIEISRHLLDESLGTNKEMVAAFVEAFAVVAYDLDAVMQGQSVVPFMEVVPHLPLQIKPLLKDQMLQKVLTFLMQKRPISVERATFFAQAEAFASMIKVDLIPLDGAVDTIIKLIAKVSTRSAAVTMFGKTMELCAAKLMAECDKEKLAKLLKSLEFAQELEFKYDVDWINGVVQSMSPYPPLVGPLAISNVALVAVDAYPGHSEMVCALTVNHKHSCVLSGSKDGEVCVWKGKDVVHRIKLPPYVYVSSIAVHPCNDMVLVTGSTNEAPDNAFVPPTVWFYDNKNNYQPVAQLSRPDLTYITCSTTMGPDSHCFALGESAPEVVAYYDMTSSSLDTLQPLHKWGEHNGMVTCLTNCSAYPDLLFSGSQDQTIRAWDRRSPTSVGVFGTINPTTGLLSAHDTMVSSVDVRDHLLASSGMDGLLRVWDLRVLGTANTAHAPLSSTNVDGQAGLKIRWSDSPAPNIAAFSTYSGLHLLDMSDPSKPLHSPVTFFTDGREFAAYHDIKWAHDQPLLYGANQGAAIDVYQLASLVPQVAA